MNHGLKKSNKCDQIQLVLRYLLCAILTVSRRYFNKSSRPSQVFEDTLCMIKANKYQINMNLIQ